MTISCIKVHYEENLNDFLFEGKVVDEVTNEPVANMEIVYEVCEIIPGSIFYRCSTKDEGTIKTDANGKFSVVVHYEDKDNDLKFYTNSKNDNYDGNTFPLNYSIEKLINEGVPEIKVNRYASLKITVKNINPINEDDSISIRYFSDDDELFRSYTLMRESLINYGNTNVFFDNGNSISGMLIWNGKNVHSGIEGKIPAAYKSVYIDYTVKKNGVYEDYKTEVINLKPDGVNEYLIEY
jgi:hypothetical protein